MNEQKTDLELIDEAVEILREVGHRHGLDRNGRDLLEYALSYAREVWISRSGQNANTPKGIYEAVTIGLNMARGAEAAANRAPESRP